MTRACHGPIRAAIGDGHRRLVGLRLDREVRLPEERLDEVTAFGGELGHERAVGRQIHAGERARRPREGNVENFRRSGLKLRAGHA